MTTSDLSSCGNTYSQVVATFTICTCADCGISFGLPLTYFEIILRDQRHITCPNGHVIYFGDAIKDDGPNGGKRKPKARPKPKRQPAVPATFPRLVA